MKRRKCFLIQKRNKSFRKELAVGVTSGSLEGKCAGLALSQLNKCECVSFQQQQQTEDLIKDDYVDYDDDDYDLVGSGLIDVRITNAGEVSPVVASCDLDQGMRCYAEDASIAARTGPGVNGPPPVVSRSPSFGVNGPPVVSRSPSFGSRSRLVNVPQDNSGVDSSRVVFG